MLSLQDPRLPRCFPVFGLSCVTLAVIRVRRSAIEAGNSRLHVVIIQAGFAFTEMICSRRFVSETLEKVNDALNNGEQKSNETNDDRMFGRGRDRRHNVRGVLLFRRGGEAGDAAGDREIDGASDGDDRCRGA